MLNNTTEKNEEICQEIGLNLIFMKILIQNPAFMLLTTQEPPNLLRFKYFGCIPLSKIVTISMNKRTGTVIRTEVCCGCTLINQTKLKFFGVLNVTLIEIKLQIKSICINAKCHIKRSTRNKRFALSAVA